MGWKKSLDGVQPSKVFSTADIASSRNVRDGFDAISDAVDGLFLTMGRSLAPAIATISQKIGELITKAEPAFKALGNSIGDTVDAVAPLVDVLGVVAEAVGNLQGIKIDVGINGDKITPFAGALTQANEVAAIAASTCSTRSGRRRATLASSTATSAVDLYTKALDEANNEQADQEAEAKKAGAAVDALTKFMDNLAKGYQAYVDATSGMDWGTAGLKGAVTAMSEFTSEHNALIDINSDAQKALDDFNQSIKDNGKSFDVSTEKGRANQKALEDVAATLDVKLAAAYTSAGGDMEAFKANAAGIAKTATDELMPAR